MKKIKFISLIMSILSSLFVFSVGFSAWFELTPPPDGRGYENEFAAEGVNELEIKIDKMSVFDYNALCFVENVKYNRNNEVESYESTNVGVISVTYSIPRATLETTGGNFTIKGELRYSGVRNPYNSSKSVSLFTEVSKGGSYEVTFDKEKLQDTEIRSDGGSDYIYFEKELTDVDTSKAYEFTVNYRFTIEPSTEADNYNFYNSLGKYIVGGETKFNASAFLDPFGSN